MITDIKLRELGENITQGTVTKIMVKTGDAIKKNQNVLELETDKAVLEVPADFEGVLQEILIKEGTTVKVGQVIFKVATGAAAAVPPPPAPAPSPKIETPKAAVPPPAPQPAKAEPVPVASTTPVFETAKNIAAAPSVRKFAREVGVDIAQVSGSGPHGRISIDDVKAFAKQLITTRPAASGMVNIKAEPLPDFHRWGDVERKPMNNVRRKTAEHLSYAWATVPHVTQFDKADITELEKLRKKYSTAERKLTITPFLLKIVAAALKNFPQFNASIDMPTNEIIYKKYFNIGVAVDTDRGLIVPVLKNIDQKNITQLATELNEIADRARNRKTTMEELQGGCFTITNLGGIGGTSFTPIVNAPEVAILGVSRAVMEPTYVDYQLIPRMMLPLSLSYDHRLIDGADGARFLRWVCDAIQNPFLLNMEK